jgi:microcystin-dependent protein
MGALRRSGAMNESLFGAPAADVPPASVFEDCTVASTTPLTVKRDGDATLTLAADTIVAGLQIGDRVRVEFADGRLIVHGRADGVTDPSGGEPAGIIKMWPTIFAPTGYLPCNGAAVSRTAEPALFAALNATVGTFTVTIATPAVVTLTAHGMQTGQQVYVTTTGALPTGVSANTNYWVIRTGADTFNLATSLANALAGTKIASSGSQSGTHTLHITSGVGDGSTTFNVPLMNGAAPVGVDTSDPDFAAPGMTSGAKTHTHAGPSHTHSTPAHTHPLSNNGAAKMTDNSASAFRIQTTSADGSSWTASREYAATRGANTASQSGGIGLFGATDASAAGTTGSGGSGNTSASSTVQPSNAVFFIIKK